MDKRDNIMDKRDNIVFGYIITMIKSGKPFSVLRSRCENRVLVNENITYNSIYYNSGIYPVGSKKALNDYKRVSIKAIKNCDVFLHHKVNPLKIHNKLVIKYNPKVKVASHNILFNIWNNNKLPAVISGKKILVISPFKKSIDIQHSKGHSILPSNINLITYKCVQSIANNKVHSTWIESLNIMKKDISKIDFDIAFLSCGSYGDALCDYIKKINKQAIYVGGSLQLWFYIYGLRWNKNQSLTDKWKKCEPEEMPNGYQRVEGGCYW